MSPVTAYYQSMTFMERFGLAVAAPLLVALLLPGCPTGVSSTPSPGAECTKRYAKCRLPDGPLGVCNDAPCEEGETEPCLRCVSQH